MVEGKGKDSVASIEDMLGPGAVMNIPVDDGKTRRKTLRFCGFNGDGEVGQKAEAIGPVRQAVMPRRAGQGIGVFKLARKHITKCATRQARRQRSNFITALEEGGA